MIDIGEILLRGIVYYPEALEVKEQVEVKNFK